MMKRKMTCIFAAVAFAMALVSCSKENLPEPDREKDQEQTQGLRTLTVSFAGGTKTTPTPGTDGETQPVWAADDEILLADGTATETYTVTADQAGVASIKIKTSLQNTVTAVYPASAAEVEGKVIKGVNVNSGQNGIFGAANICMAVEANGVLSFENKTAVFKVEVPAHTSDLVVTSLGELDETTGYRGATSRDINNNGLVVNNNKKITVKVTDSDSPTTCYVSVLVDENNPVILTNLNFDAAASETAGSQGGFSALYLKETKNIEDPYAFKIEAGTIYNLPAASLHPYVVIDGKKWATMNVGASSSTDNGEYFACGSTDGQTWNGTNWSGMGFSSIPLLAGTISDTLPLKYDAANVNWGGAWHMPTKGDFEALIPFSQPGNAYSFSDSNGNQINFPAAGFGRENSLDTNSSGYWSSSLSDNEAYCLEFSNFGANAAPYSRKFGQPVRPVSD